MGVSGWLFTRQGKVSQGMEHQSSISLLLTLVACLCLSLTVSAQNTRRGKTIIVPLPKDRSGLDVYPDCNRGKVCLPDAQYCSIRKNKVGSTQFQDKNYCRKHCMDLVSFESEDEWNWIMSFLRGAGIKELWTAGRLCDAEVNGCDAPHYQPLDINGWFWASTLVQMLPTNRSVGLNPDGVRVIGVNEWAKTGPKGVPQPDGFTPAGGLGEEPCMAVIDGAWHDTSCHNRRSIVCEDLPDRNIQFVRNENPNIFIP